MKKGYKLVEGIVFTSILFSDLLLHRNPSIPFVGHGVCNETVGEDDYTDFESNPKNQMKFSQPMGVIC